MADPNTFLTVGRDIDLRSMGDEGSLALLGGDTASAEGSLALLGGDTASAEGSLTLLASPVLVRPLVRERPIQIEI
jgi:hypothetical protein